MHSTRQLFTTAFSAFLIMAGPLAAGAALAQTPASSSPSSSTSAAAAGQGDDRTADGSGKSGASATASGAAAGGQGQAAAAAEPRNDERLDPSEPDFTLITLPTTLRLPQYKSAFRVTHRFSRPLGDGSFGDLASDFFALDSGAQIGLEYRFGLLPGLQVGVNRTSNRTIQMFTEYDIHDQGGAWPISLSAWGSIDGTNNFRDSYSPTLGVVISRKLGRHGAVYAVPMWVNNSNVLPSELADHNSTAMIGVGTRVRVRPTVYLLVETVPRVAGYDPGETPVSFGVEKRVGGHSFQLNFSNSLGTTMGQIAQGGPTPRAWYLGFNITRKFF